MPRKRKTDINSAASKSEEGSVPFKKYMNESREKSEPSGEDELPLSQDSVMSEDDLNYGNCFDVLTLEGFTDVAEVLQGEGVTSEVLDMVTEEQLERLGISPLGRRLKALKLLREITGKLYTYKIVNDPIHGHIEIHPLCVKIIDTPQFQRLRFLRQLGGSYFVYPGASHNRFEHSLGVCYLAGELASTLRKRQPELGISNNDILCVQIAGLCHDLGHGPFSHMFDGKFLPVARPDKKIKHEDLSVKMFDHLVESNDLNSVFEKYGVTEQDRTFIKEQIAGPLKLKSKEWPYHGRSKEKGFLYEIVANKRNGIDVDKWDYFARDCHMLGIRNNFDHIRCMKYARVLSVNGELQICSRDKEVGNLYDMFHTRNTLHRRAYQHSVGNIIETMITEAMLKADDIIKIPGKNGELRKMSESVDDMEAYQKLADDIFQKILWSTDPLLEESRKILMNVQKRELYKCVGQTRPPQGKTLDQKSGLDQIKDEFVDILKSMDSHLQKEDIIIHLVYLDYGMKDENPIDHVRFYNKKDPAEPIQVRKNEVSDLLPERFAEQLIRFYSKKRDDESVKQATQAFNVWSKKHQCSVGANNLLPYMTPVKSDSTTPDGADDGTPSSSGILANQSTPGSASKFKSRLSFN
ncbi:deoxynucleoside triphosphate triphosphohydrolase SAMHD1-like [Saccostrea echinata]|uniref:deoxynucleoside triphosphate triphosphohydrolase SAMHD1-like n=1 Tax=Saccostrea echinata TaxID=191078 RepID=UPI002A8296A2|nr:deoxynucleoside triphosphate triphosphohydrolase SAMHD1-like [Saccostrea echinata]